MRRALPCHAMRPLTQCEVELQALKHCHNLVPQQQLVV